MRSHTPCLISRAWFLQEYAAIKTFGVSSHIQIVKLVLICKSIVSMRRESKNAITRLKGIKQCSSCTSVTNELGLKVKVEQSFAIISKCF